MTGVSAGAAAAPGAGRDRGYWLKTLHQWHWISSAVCLLGLLLFAVTGFTLNHASQIEARPVVVDRKGALPEALRPALRYVAGERLKRSDALPPAVSAWVASALAADVAGREAEWSEDEVMVSMPRPGGDAWLRIDRASGEAEFEDTDRGWLSWLNDLHKGRHAGTAWSWFIDVFAVACLVFALTGLFILKLHAANRPSTWPLVGLGVVLPLLLVILFVH